MGVIGNSGGKKGRSGRKTRAHEMGLKQLLDETFPLEDRKEIISRLVAMAKNEQLNTDPLEAMKVLLAYTFGKPTERQEITGADGAPLIPRSLTIVIDDKRNSETK